MDLAENNNTTNHHHQPAKSWQRELAAIGDRLKLSPDVVEEARSLLNIVSSAGDDHHHHDQQQQQFPFRPAIAAALFLSLRQSTGNSHISHDGGRNLSLQSILSATSLVLGHDLDIMTFFKLRKSMCDIAETSRPILKEYRQQFRQVEAAYVVLQIVFLKFQKTFVQIFGSGEEGNSNTTELLHLYFELIWNLFSVMQPKLQYEGKHIDSFYLVFASLYLVLLHATPQVKTRALSAIASAAGEAGQNLPPMEQLCIAHGAEYGASEQCFRKLVSLRDVWGGGVEGTADEDAIKNSLATASPLFPSLCNPSSGSSLLSHLASLLNQNVPPLGSFDPRTPLQRLASSSQWLKILPPAPLASSSSSSSSRRGTGGSDNNNNNIHNSTSKLPNNNDHNNNTAAFSPSSSSSNRLVGVIAATPERSGLRGTRVQDTPTSVVLSATKWLAQCSGAGESTHSELAAFFEASENGNLQAEIAARVDALLGPLSLLGESEERMEKIRSTSRSLYYYSLRVFLKSEEARTGRTNFSQMLSSDELHRSLLAVCLLLVTHIYDASLSTRDLLSLVRIPSIVLVYMCEQFVQPHSKMPDMLRRHLAAVCDEIFDFLAWEPTSLAVKLLEEPSAQEFIRSTANAAVGGVGLPSLHRRSLLSSTPSRATPSRRLSSTPSRPAWAGLPPQTPLKAFDSSSSSSSIPPPSASRPPPSAGNLPPSGKGAAVSLNFGGGGGHGENETIANSSSSSQAAATTSSSTATTMTTAPPPPSGLSKMNQVLLQTFVRRVVGRAHVRLHAVCTNLEPRQTHQIENLARKCELVFCRLLSSAEGRQLLRGRHLDQILACVLFSVSTKIECPSRTFKQLNAAFRSAGSANDLFRSVATGMVPIGSPSHNNNNTNNNNNNNNGTNGNASSGDIIRFYNDYFVTAAKAAVLDVCSDSTQTQPALAGFASPAASPLRGGGGGIWSAASGGVGNLVVSPLRPTALSMIAQQQQQQNNSSNSNSNINIINNINNNNNNNNTHYEDSKVEIAAGAGAAAASSSINNVFAAMTPGGTKRLYTFEEYGARQAGAFEEFNEACSSSAAAAAAAAAAAGGAHQPPGSGRRVARRLNADYDTAL